MLICTALFAIASLAEVTVTQQQDRISVSIDNSSPTTFWYGPGVTKPYLWPLHTASGIELTRGWPMQDRPGDPHDHPHQRGLWFAHALVNGIDFWNSDPGYHTANMGRTSVVKVDRLTSGRKVGTVAVELSWKDPKGEEIIHENRAMTFSSGNPRFIDFDIHLSATRDVVFGDEKDGVFGIRLAHELEEPAKDDPLRTGQMIASTGCRQEKECWGKTADWLDVSGRIDGRDAGVTVFDDPSNPRHPPFWHARGYGLLAANIFGVRAFTGKPNANGSLSVPAGQELHFRYRVVLHEGDAAAEHPAALYRAWTKSRH